MRMKNIFVIINGNVKNKNMIDQSVNFKAPIKIIHSKIYYLIIEDADGVRHYFHHKHKNEYGDFKQGQYDGWSYTPAKSFECKLSDDITLNIN
jgi:hypothetical protein